MNRRPADYESAGLAAFDRSGDWAVEDLQRGRAQPDLDVIDFRPRRRIAIAAVVAEKREVAEVLTPVLAHRGRSGSAITGECDPGAVSDDLEGGPS